MPSPTIPYAASRPTGSGDRVGGVSRLAYELMTGLRCRGLFHGDREVDRLSRTAVLTINPARILLTLMAVQGVAQVGIP